MHFQQDLPIEIKFTNLCYFSKFELDHGDNYFYLNLKSDYLV